MLYLFFLLIEKVVIVVRTLEAIFRHPIQLLVMLIFPIIVSLVIAFVLPRSYQASASLWALRRYEIIGATGPETNLLATPAETQVSALSEMLQSRSFALTVAKSANVISTLRLSDQELANPQVRDDALVKEISQHVQVTSKGYNLYEVSYTSNDPVVAQRVVKTVIDEYKKQGQLFSVTEGQRILAAYQTQLTQAKSDTDKAAVAESQYLTSHPEIAKSGNNPLNDPQYALLDSKRLQEQSILQNLQSTIASLKQTLSAQSTGVDSFFSIVDAPIVPDIALSRLRLFLMSAGVGAGIGVLACILYILILMRRDRAIYSSSDLQKVTALPTLMELPHFSLATKKVAVQIATEK
jgi:uncharacterized protein involved in exopolysaccharide biosynthesis